MGPRWGLLGLLLAAGCCLLESKRSSSPHVIRVSYSSATEDCPGLPLFSAEGYVNNELITRYESRTRKMHPRVDWINTLEKEDPRFYDRYTSILRDDQEDFQENVYMLQKRYNQSGGYHIVQMMITCEVREDGTRSGRWHYGYDGRHFLKYDMGTSSWFAADKEALLIKWKWESETAIMQRFRGYLESTCTEWMKKNEHYGLNASLRKEPPMVKMSSRTELVDGMETHICEPYGFYPREIDAFWTRDGEVWLQDTFHKSVAPNSDGTYHYWLSIQIDPQERDRYQCYVDHDGLAEPLELALKVPQSRFNLWYIIGAAAAGIVIMCAIVGILAFRRFKKGDDEPKNDPPCTSSLMTNC
ncbi:class I histocompatibility antigen, F10 alpha chain-like isoform X1 [Erythrolamprus reginae]|uniref:class I histocompatibility antigen, F10 alpha chain-like isoform X1 n=1 Tax=Erythrolamprus reginae TaxID=121349 RepID=UPI00396C3E7D